MAINTRTRMLALVLCGLLLSGLICEAGIPLRFRSFDNLLEKTVGLPVRCTLQDSYGTIWIGTNRGLYSFDGFNLKKHRSDRQTGSINCMLLLNGLIYMGCENGLFALSPEHQSTAYIDTPDLRDITAIDTYRGQLVTGTFSGLYIYSPKEMTVRELTAHDKDMPRSILSMNVAGHNVYLGGMSSFGKYDLRAGSYSEIECRNPVVVGSMRKDNDGESLWIGTAVSLIKMDLATEKTYETASLPIVKAIEQDTDGTLLLGTDHGLYILDRKNRLNHVTHDSRYDSSLADDVIWNIMKDDGNNWWFSTDNGISVSCAMNSGNVVPLFSVTGMPMGNQLSSIYRMRGGDVWMGGNNGVIALSGLDTDDPACKWFHMDNADYNIPHNRIRKISEDSEHKIWIATDRGLLYKDSGDSKFSQVIVRDRSYWIYDIAYGSDGTMWIASYSGVYAIRPESGHLAHMVDALASYGLGQGLRTERITRLALDGNDFLWVLGNGNIDIIDTRSGTVRPADPEPGVKHSPVTCIKSDPQGMIWAVAGNMLYGLRLSEGKIIRNRIELPLPDDTHVQDMEIVGDDLWIAATGAMVIVDKTGKSKRKYMTDLCITSIYHDSIDNQIWLGSIDRFLTIDAASGIAPSRHDVRASSLRINDQREIKVKNGDKITLPQQDNSIQIQFSGSRNVGAHFSNLVFLLEGGSDRWLTLEHNRNTIFLPNLTTGKYRLYVSPADKTDEASPLLEIEIRPHWYLSGWALSAYAAIAAAIVMWAINHIIVRRKLENERHLRKLNEEQSKTRMQFLTNVAHEFKSPLSLIISASGRLRHRIKDPKGKELLEIVHSSTLKLNSLLRISLETYREGAQPESILHKEIEIVELARCVCDNFLDLHTGRPCDLSFVASDSNIRIYADAFKIETILANLLTYAWGFATDTSKMTLSISREENSTLLISLNVTDVCNQDPAASEMMCDIGNHQPTETLTDSIGLNVVREYVHMHGGVIRADICRKLLTYEIEMPVAIADEHTGTPAQNQGIDVPECQTACDDRDLPVVAIVDGNEHNTRFMTGILGDEYRCHVAHNGKAGLKLCAEIDPDIIVTALSMPVMDGFKMCRELRGNKKFSATPVIMLADRDDEKTEMKGIRTRIDAFVRTPVDYQLLKARISQLLQRKSILEERLRLESITVSDSVDDTRNGVRTDEQFIKEIYELVESEMSRTEISVSWLSEKTGMSEKQLYRRVKNITGLSTTEFIRDIRLEKASRYLRDDRLNISEAMYRTGFSHASYFSRCFKKKFGMTPTEYQQTKDI